MKDRPFRKVIAAAAIAGLAVIFGMRAFGFGELSVGIAGLGVFAVVYFFGSRRL